MSTNQFGRRRGRECEATTVAGEGGYARARPAVLRRAGHIHHTVPHVQSLMLLLRMRMRMRKRLLQPSAA